MPFDKSPQKLIKGWTVEDPNYAIPVSFLPELTKINADPEFGDSRAIVFAFLESFYQWFNALPQEDKPTKLQINRSSYVDDAQNTVSRSYNVTVSTSLTAFNVAKEDSNEDKN